MNIILSNEENLVKNWQFKDIDQNLEFVSNIAVTNKRFIYQKELERTSTQKCVSRYDIPLENIKSVESFYGEKRNLFWLVCAVVGIFLSLLSILPFITEEVEMGIFCIIVGAALAVAGIFFHINPDKSPLKLKKPNFSVTLETKGANGQSFCLGGGHGFTLRGKGTVNPTLWLFPPVAIYKYIINKNKNGIGLELPEEVAFEIIETLGSVIFC